MSGYTKIVDHYEDVNSGRVTDSLISELTYMQGCSLSVFEDIFYIYGYDHNLNKHRFFKFYFINDESIKAEELETPASIIQDLDQYAENCSKMCPFDNKIYALLRDNTTDDWLVCYYDITASTWVLSNYQIPKYEDGSFILPANGLMIVYNNELHFIGSYGNCIGCHFVLRSDGWEDTHDIFPPGYTFYANKDRSVLVIYNNTIYVGFDDGFNTDTKYLYYLDNSEWKLDNHSLPGALLDINSELYIFNGSMIYYDAYAHRIPGSTKMTLLYKYDDNGWEDFFDITTQDEWAFLESPSTIYNNKIYAFNRLNGFYYLYQNAITLLKRFERACISVPTDETVKRDGVPYVKYTNKMVRKAWVWGSLVNDQPNKWLLALDSADYFVYHSRTLPSGLPYDFYSGSSVIFDGKLHILGGRDNPNKHFSFNGTIWTEESELPFNLTMDNRAVAYDGKIQVLGWKSGLDAHYSWDGTSWEQESELPYNLYGGCVATYNNKIHIIGGYDEFGYSKKHRVWDGTSWEEAIDAPYLIGQDSLCVIFNGKLRILAGSSVAPYKKDPGSAYYHYSWDDFIWTRELDLDFSQPSKAVVCDNKLYIYEYNNYKSYLSLNNVWTKISKVTPYNVEDASMINYHDQINLLGGDQSRGQNVWNATENRWQEIKLPNLKDFYNGSAIIFDNKIHILGGTVDPRMHYSWDMDTETLIWEEESRLPYDFNDGAKSGSVASVIYDNKIHIFGGRTASIRRNHYSWDGTVWTAEELLPYTGLAMGDVVIFRNQMHVLGITTPNQASSGPVNIINHFKWDDHDPEHPGWLFQSEIPSDIGPNFRVVVWNDAIHIIGKTKHYSWTPETLTWKEESTLPYEQPAEAIVVGNYIRIMGSELNESEAVNCYYGKYVKNKFTWTKYDNLLVGYDSGSAVMGRILYLLSGKKSYNSDVIQTTNDGKFK